MGAVTTVAIFFTVWWTVLFAVLPWGVRTPEQADIGMADSAPQNPNLLFKFAVTTAVSVGITFALWLVADSGIVSFHAMAKRM